MNQFADLFQKNVCLTRIAIPNYKQNQSHAGYFLLKIRHVLYCILK